MPSSEDFSALVNRAMTASGHTHMRPVIEKELLHYDILFSLDREGLLDLLAFQGGHACVFATAPHVTAKSLILPAEWISTASD